MIELNDNELRFNFLNVHRAAECSIEFQRTLRIPDDNQEYPLPPGLGSFPVEHVDDYSHSLPALWQKHGGLFLPMYQSEALWINFSGNYPCAIKVAAGKINAISGKSWVNALANDPQDYLVLPDQPWLDGFNVSEDYIRQFVAMPLGDGYTAEEQITGEADVGGLQIIVYPMKRECYIEQYEHDGDTIICNSCIDCLESEMVPDMGLSPGGLMRQKIYEDKYGIDAWDLDNGLRCFIHLSNSQQYQSITGHRPPHQPPSASDYMDAGLPWFDYYDDSEALSGSENLSRLTSIAAKGIGKGAGIFPDNKTIYPSAVEIIGNHNVVRDGEF